MKKFILTIMAFLVLTSLALATIYTTTLNNVTLDDPITPTVWYVSDNGSGALDGTSQANAWPVSSISWSAMRPSDMLDVCGTVHSLIAVQTTGLATAYPFYLNGNCPNNQGIIDGATIITNSWSSVSSNVYSTAETTLLNPGKWGVVTEDGTALVGIRWQTDAPTTIAAMVAYGDGTWSYDPTNKILYVLTAATDSPAGHTMEASYGQLGSGTLNVLGHSNVTVENIEIINSGDYAVRLSSNKNFVLQNSTINNVSNIYLTSTNVTNPTFTSNTITNASLRNVTPIVPFSWYVTAAGAGSKNGTSQANAWANNSIGWNSVDAGDTVYICGTINAPLQVSGGGGISGHPVIINGSCPGNAGIYDGANVVTTWTPVSSNVYSTPLASGSGPWGSIPFGIVTEDDAALIGVPWNTNIATTTPLMVSTAATYSLGTWTYDSVNGLLYVLTTAADDPTGHTMEASYGGSNSFLILSSGQSYVTFENLTVKNAGDYGFDILSGTGTTITSCTIYNIDNWSIYSANVTTMITSNNTLHHVVWQEHIPFPSNLGVGEGIRYQTNTGGSIFGNTIYDDPSAGVDLTGNTTGVNVYNNTIHDNIGMTVNYSNGVYSDDAQNNFIYNNLIYNYMSGISLSSETPSTVTSGTYVYNNLVYNFYYTGIYVGAVNGSANDFVFNNTFVNGPSSKPGANQALAVLVSTNDTVKNNIFWGDVYFYAPGIISTPGFFDYNQYLNTNFNNADTGRVTFSAWQTTTGGDTNSGNSSPSLGSVFVNAPALDFDLVAASAPVGTGLNLTSLSITNLNIDYAGNARPSTGAWDVGAYENI